MGDGIDWTPGFPHTVPYRLDTDRASNNFQFAQFQQMEAVTRRHRAYPERLWFLDDLVDEKPIELRGDFKAFALLLLQQLLLQMQCRTAN